MASLNQELIFRLTSDGKIDDENNVTIDCKCTGEKIVRCRNCRYYSTEYSSGCCDRLFIYDEREGFSVSENDHCSFGIEKEEK